MEKKEKKATYRREERRKGEKGHWKERIGVEMDVYEIEWRYRGIRHIVESER